MKATCLASLGALAVGELATAEAALRIAAYAAPVLVGLWQAFRKHKGRKRTAKARQTRQGALPLQ